MISIGAFGYTGGAHGYCAAATGNQAEINDAIDYVAELGGGTVQLVGSPFLITSSILLKNGVRLDANGARIYAAGAVNLIAFNGINNAALVNAVLDLPGVAAMLVYIYNGSTNIEVGHCTCNGGGNYAIYAGDSFGVSVHDNYVTGAHTVAALRLERGTTFAARNRLRSLTGSYGLQIINGTANVVRENDIDGVYMSPTLGMCYGIHIWLSDDTAVICNRVMNVSSGNGDTPGNITAIKVEDSASDRTYLIGNDCIDNGNIMSFGGCEAVGASTPHIVGDGATITNCTLTAVNSPTPYDGSFCIQVNKDSAGGAGDAVWTFHSHAIGTTTDMSSLLVGRTYTLTMRAQCPAAVAVGNMLVRFGYYSGGSWHDQDYNPVAQDVWEAVSLTCVIPAVATGIRAYVQIASAEAQNDKVFVDAIRFIPRGPDNDHLQQFVDAGTDTRLG